MRVYDIWDYIGTAIDILHLVGLLSLLVIMGLLMFGELKKFK